MSATSLKLAAGAGEATPAGYVGETIPFTNITANTGNTWTNTGSITLTAGKWVLMGSQNGSGSSTDIMNVGFSTTNSGFPTFGCIATTLGLGNHAIFAPITVTVTTPTSYYIMSNRSAGSTVNWGNGSIAPFAIRIA